MVITITNLVQKPQRLISSRSVHLLAPFIVKCSSPEPQVKCSFILFKYSVSPSLPCQCALALFSNLAQKKFFREINCAGLGGLINSSCQLIVLHWCREKPPKRGAAALNQFHGPFITSTIKPIFRV